MIQKFNVVFDPPDQPKWRQMSVDKLKQLIEEHRHDNSVLKFLCGVDTESEYFEGKFFEIEQEDIPPTRELKRGDSVEIERYYKEKIYYSMIGFACKDSDGARGEAKIRVILKLLGVCKPICRFYCQPFARSFLEGVAGTTNGKKTLM